MSPQTEESRERKYAALLAELHGESERACAIVGAAWVEESLQQAIESVLHPHSEARDRLFSEAAGGPLSTFAAKIDLACVFGFITDSIRKDLQQIARIRNQFAHVIAHKTTQEKLSFSSDYIGHRCLALHCVAHLKLSDPREAFMRGCATLSNDFEMILFMSGGKVPKGGKVPDSGRVFAEGVDFGNPPATPTSARAS